MTRGLLDRVVRHVRDLVTDPAASGPTDGQLLARFAEQRDEAAFEALLKRYAPLVLGVCRRALHEPHDVEDAFQAVFFVLARKAGRLDRRAPLANWLFTVARLVALKMRAQQARRRAGEAKAPGRPPSDPLAEINARQLYSALDEELTRLPEKYRAPLLLCYLEGSTQDEAARRLGVSLSTLKRRLGAARESLRRRLTRRGLSLSAALPALLLSQSSSPAATSLVFSTTRVSSRAAALAREALKAMSLSKLTTAAVFVGLALAVSAAGILRLTALAGPQPVEQARTLGTVGKQPTVGKDRYGDPLPAGAVARLGTVRFRHGLSVDRVVFSPDGKMVASWDCFRGVVLWDVATGRAVRELPVGIDAAAVTFAPDGKTLAVPHCSTRRDIVIGLFDAATGREIRQLRGGSANYPTLAFSHNGKLLAAVDYNSSLRVWDVATGRKLRETQKGLGGLVLVWQAVAFSPDDRTLAVTGRDGTVGLQDVSTGESRGRLEGHGGPVFALRFAPDGRSLISAGADGFRLWDLGAGKQVRAWGEKCVDACLSQDGKTLASAHAGGRVRLWDVARGKAVRDWRAHHGEVRTLAFSPDGRLLASGGGGDSTVRLWDVAAGKEVRPRGTHRGTIQALAFNPDGTTLLACSRDRLLVQWDLATQAPRSSCPFEVDSPYFAVALSPDRRTFATADPDGRPALRIHDLATGKVIRSLGGGAAADRLVFSPDGKAVACAGRDLLVRLWDTGTGKEVRRFHGPMVLVKRLAFSPDGRLLAAIDSQESGKAHNVHLWETATGKEQARVGRAGVIDSIAFSRDGRVLAVAGRGPGIELWEVLTGRRIRRLDWPEPKRDWHMTPAWTGELAFSNDGRLLASGGGGKRPGDYSIRVWDVVTGKEVRRFEGHPTMVTQLAFSPDDRRLASGGTDSTIVLWDVPARREKAGARSPRLSEKELKARWEDLAGPDAERAYRAAWALAAAPEDSVPFLKARLTAVGRPREVGRLIADLDSDRFARREQARRALEKLGMDAEADLRRALEAGPPSLEMRRRLERLLEGLQLSPDWLRYLRAVHVLEYAATPEARGVLQSLTRGAPGSRLTRDAKAALARLTRTPGRP